jgi:hypothetical protein
MKNLLLLKQCRSQNRKSSQSTEEPLVGAFVAVVTVVVIREQQNL